MPHILVAGKIHEAGLDLIKSAKGFTYEQVMDVTYESYAPLLPKADAVLLRTQPLQADLVAKCPNLKIVSRHGVGYDAVDVTALNVRKIALAQVRERLPAGTATMSAAQRVAQIEIRQEHVARRYRQY